MSLCVAAGKGGIRLRFYNRASPLSTPPCETLPPGSPFKLRIYTFANCNLRSAQNCNQGQMGLWRQGRTVTQGRGSHQHRGDIGTFPGKWGRHTAGMSDSCQLLSSLIALPGLPLGPPLSPSAHGPQLPWAPGPDDIIPLPPASHSFHASVPGSFPSLSALLSSAHCVHFRLLR